VHRPVVAIEVLGERGDTLGGTVGVDECPEQFDPSVGEDLPQLADLVVQSEDLEEFTQVLEE